MQGDLDRQKPDKDTARARLKRMMRRAGKQGEEDVISQTFRLERQGVLDASEAKSLRFEAYAHLVRWHQQNGGGDTASPDAPDEAGWPAARSKKAGENESGAPSRQEQRKEAMQRAREWRKTTRRLRMEAAEGATDPIAAAAMDTIDEVARLADLHETAAEVDVLAQFWAAQPALDKLPAAHAHKLLLHSERLIDQHVPEALFAHIRDSGSTAPGAEALLIRREARLEHPPLQDTDLVSLGRNCLPWTLPNRWGLRRSEQVLTLDCPFNLAMHSFDATLQAISSDFDGYADPRNMTQVETQNGHFIAYNRRYRALWNHEKNGYWLDNEFANLRHHLEQRVDNFRAAMQSGRKLAFVMATDEFDPDEVQDRARELHGVLRERSTASDLILLCFSHDPEAQAGITEAGASVFHIARPMPAHGYIWHNEVDYSSPAGIAFERAWTNDLRSILSDRGFA